MRAVSDFAQPGPALESHEWLERFSDRLFDAGDACVVEFSAEPHSTALTPRTALPLRAPLTADVPTALNSPHAIGETRLASAASARSGVVSTAIAEITGRLSGIAGQFSGNIPEAARQAIARAVAALRAVRARWWFALGAAGILVGVALVLIPSRQAVLSHAPTPVASAHSEGLPTTAPDATSAENPVDALVALLGSRERCIAQLSVLCLDAVDQSGSAALAADQALVRSLQSGGESAEAWAIDESRMAVVERLGDSALVVVADPAETEPASVLLMKGEAGWRIRDYLAG